MRRDPNQNNQNSSWRRGESLTQRQQNWGGFGVQNGFSGCGAYVDADHNVIDRKVIPYRYLARKDAVDAIESVMPSFSASRYQSEGDFWWAVTEDGSTRVRFIIESV